MPIPSVKDKLSKKLIVFFLAAIIAAVLSIKTLAQKSLDQESQDKDAISQEALAKEEGSSEKASLEEKPLEATPQETFTQGAISREAATDKGADAEDAEAAAREAQARKEKDLAAQSPSNPAEDSFLSNRESFTKAVEEFQAMPSPPDLVAAILSIEAADAEEIPSDEPYPALYTSKTLFIEAMEQVSQLEPSKNKVTGVIVPHHMLAPDLIAKGFAFARSGKYKRVVILCPDHFKRTKTTASVPRRSFPTILGRSALDDEDAQILLEDPLFSQSDLFSHEHAIQALLPFIIAYFPEATVLPVALSTKAPVEEWPKLAEKLSTIINEDTLLVQSTDFSHHLQQDAAKARDEESLSVLRAMDPDLIPGLHQSGNVDSKASMFILMSLQKAAGATIEILDHKNACDYLQDREPCPAASDLTTYIIAAYLLKDLPAARPEKAGPKAP